MFRLFDRDRYRHLTVLAPRDDIGRAMFFVSNSFTCGCSNFVENLAKSDSDPTTGCLVLNEKFLLGLNNALGFRLGPVAPSKSLSSFNANE